MAWSSTRDGVRCSRLYNVEGTEGKRNDVVHCRNCKVQPERNVIFFGGDVQDFPENMLAHRDNKHYERWNLENTAQMMQARFPNCDVWVVRPSKMQLKTFSIYGNFAECDDVGSPTHSEHYGAWAHLSRLLNTAVKQVNSQSPGEDPTTCSAESSTSCNGGENTALVHPANPSLPISIIGFSKGCVVPNQLLHELQHAKDNPELKDFVGQVTHMYWLDGGHNGGSKTWVTDPEVLKGLLGLRIEIHVHVTPYQVRDAMRKWIGQEHKKFIVNLRKLGVSVFDTMHFANEERSLENHFQVLLRF